MRLFKCIGLTQENTTTFIFILMKVCLVSNMYFICTKYSRLTGLVPIHGITTFDQVVISTKFPGCRIESNARVWIILRIFVSDFR